MYRAQKSPQQVALQLQSSERDINEKPAHVSRKATGKNTLLISSL